MVSHKLIFVTVLLLCLSYSFLYVYTSVCIFGITLVTTYICYTLNTRLRLENYLKYLKIPNFIGGASKTNDHTHQQQPTSANRKHDGLRSFPKPIAKILDRYITSILRDFVESWYLYLGPDEKDFLEETRIVIEHITVELHQSLKDLSLPNVTVNLINVFQKHIKTFDECQAIVHKKYPNLREEDFAPLISELYEEAVVPHVATQSKGSELDYLKTLIDMLLQKYVPAETFSCLSGRFLLREILAIQCLEPLVQIFTDPHFVNEVIIDVLEPSLPLPVILKQWEDAYKEIESEELENDQSRTMENVDISSPETNYESTHEHLIKAKTPPKKTSGKVRNRKSHTRPKAKKQSKKIFNMNDSSGDDSDIDQTKNMFRFDKLDMKTSYPVYGSTSARDHERTKKGKLDLKLSQGIEEIEPIDSGRAPSLAHSEHDHDVTDSPVKEKGGWAVCPPSRDQIFRHPSFYGMPLKQDELAEQLKARVSSVPEFSAAMLRQMSTINCIDPCLRGDRTISCSSMDMHIEGMKARNFTQSIDGSVTMNFGRKSQVPPSVNPSTTTAVTPKSIENKKEEDEIVRVHKSGEEGAFYEIAPSCPTCIEMTYLASPFQNERAQVVFTEKELKEREKRENERRKTVRINIGTPKFYEHECGLYSEHFCNAEADTESYTVDPLALDNSLAPCSEPIDISDHSVSSGTLLASGETFEESEKVPTEEGESSSFDNISDVSFASRSDLSLDTSLDYEIVPTSRVSKNRVRKLSHAASVQTFKTALEGSVLDEHTRLRSSSSNSLDLAQRKSTIDKQFLQFFKKGIQKFPSKKRKSKQTTSQRNEKIQNIRKKIRGKLLTKKGKLTRVEDDELKIESSSISTSPTKFNSLPEYPSSIHTHWRDPKDLVEEEGLEVEEEEEVFQSNIDPSMVVDPLSKEIAVTDKDLPIDSKSVKSVESKGSKENAMFAGMVDPTTAVAVSGANGAQDPSYYIPIFEGEVIMPHPSKLPAAWLYPIQMISIPSTEVATEKGWEPGINKYTLYGIHYDIRIWPDQYQKQLVSNTNSENKEESVPLIREIKRRYREFLFLHNRLTHRLSKDMKGILRPNRRYAMPFGRMDPDVIEGRRKILETYLVSLVSRPELCNSREFKDFLGSEEYDDVISLKNKKKKQVYKSKAKRIVSEVKQEHALHVGQKETVDRLGMNSPYFIHGYVVPRMFGYAEDDAVDKHSKLVLSHFVLNYPLFKNHKHHPSVRYESAQAPTYFQTSPAVNCSLDNSGRTTPEPSHPLGPRTDGDGAEVPDLIHSETVLKANLINEKGADPKRQHGAINPSIAAKFSEELAAKLHQEREELASRIAHEKSLYQSSWPLTDAVLAIACQILRGYKSWLSFERVQQAILFSLGGVIEWLINRELDEAVMKERCYKYLNDLYNVIWDEHDVLRSEKPKPTTEEKRNTKEKCLQRLMDFIPSFVRMSIGTPAYKGCCTKLVKSLQYERINKHILYAALEVILQELAPECSHGVNK
uniref:Sorting nexin-19 n=1 Tax=Clytia hemisphaerica TaxID=252671 RepID=A0A7M5URJ2_9CNID